MRQVKNHVVRSAVERRLNALQGATKQPRARCIGMLEAEYKDELKDRLEALEELFQEVATGKTKP